MLKPDENTIKKHINWVFTGTEHQDARFEIGSLYSSNTENFSYEETDKAAGRAKANNDKRLNVYLVYAGLNPDVMPFGRSNDDNFYTTNFVWCDIDEEHAPEALKEKYKSCPPNIGVITAKTPHRRVQLVWKLREPCEDPDTLREALIGLAQHLGGDTMVTNPTSLMRLAGTVNYPTEKKRAAGRIPEITELHGIQENTYYIEDIISAFPVTDYQQSYTEPLNAKPEAIYEGGLAFEEKITDGRDIYMSRMVFASIVNYVQENGAWPEPQDVFDDVWPVYSRKVTQRDGRSLEQDGRGEKLLSLKIKSKLRAFKAGAMKRHGLGSLEEIAENRGKSRKEDAQEVSTDFNIQDWSVRNKFKGEAPEMEWLIEGILPAQAPMMLAAIGGIGKSFKMLEIALSVSCCVSSNGIIQKRILGGPIAKYGNTVIITAEDSESSIHRRLNKIDPNEHRNAGKYQTYIVPTSELKQGTAPIISQTNDGMKVTEFYNSLYKQLKDIPDLRLVVIDPLQAFVDGDISSSNEVAQAVFSRCIIPLSTQLKCTVLVVHHMNKEGGLGRILTGRDARKAIRGVTGLVDGGRGTYCLWEPADDVKLALAAHFGEDKDAENFAQGAVVKFNDEHNHEITTFYRGENGVLEDMGHVDILGAGVITLTNEQAGNALREIRMAWESGNPYRASTQSPRCIVKWLMKTFNIKKQQAMWQRDNWLCPPLGSEPLIEERLYKDAQRKERMGLYVKRIP